MLLRAVARLRQCGVNCLLLGLFGLIALICAYQGTIILMR